MKRKGENPMNWDKIKQNGSVILAIGLPAYLLLVWGVTDVKILLIAAAIGWALVFFGEKIIDKIITVVIIIVIASFVLTQFFGINLRGVAQMFGASRAGGGGWSISSLLGSGGWSSAAPTLPVTYSFLPELSEQDHAVAGYSFQGQIDPKHYSLHVKRGQKFRVTAANAGTLMYNAPDGSKGLCNLESCVGLELGGRILRYQLNDEFIATEAGDMNVYLHVPYAAKKQALPGMKFATVVAVPGEAPKPDEVKLQITRLKDVLEKDIPSSLNIAQIVDFTNIAAWKDYVVNAVSEGAVTSTEIFTSALQGTPVPTTYQPSLDQSVGEVTLWGTKFEDWILNVLGPTPTKTNLEEKFEIAKKNAGDYLDRNRHSALELDEIVTPSPTATEVPTATPTPSPTATPTLKPTETPKSTVSPTIVPTPKQRRIGS
jgi:hypothetical protein